MKKSKAKARPDSTRQRLLTCYFKLEGSTILQRHSDEPFCRPEQRMGESVAGSLGGGGAVSLIQGPYSKVDPNEVDGYVFAGATKAAQPKT